MGHFGDKFRKAREKKELSLDDVSNVTKISARMRVVPAAPSINNRIQADPVHIRNALRVRLKCCERIASDVEDELP